MDPVSGMLLGGAALGGLNSLLGVGASAADAALQYHYAKKMYQHRYRWAMSDMQKAGLNPVLAANGGNVSGMGSAPSTDFAGAAQSGISSALGTVKTLSDIKAQQASNEKAAADARLADAQNSLTVQRSLAQKIENQQLPFKVEYIANKALAESSLAEANALSARARASYAYENAENEAFRLRENARRSLHSSYNEEMRGRLLYNEVQSLLPPEEKRIWNRVMQGAGVVGKGVNSAVGVGKLRWLFRK